MQTIMLLLGGFAIAAALSKHFIAKQLAVAILSRVGRKPHHVLLANMLVATFASMWISNVAAPVLCFSLVQPILRTLPTNHPFCKSLVLGIALASNLGGMTSPISSPQNIFAIERMSMGGTPPSWLQWFAIALPVSFLGNLICWALILAVYKPGLNIKEVRHADCALVLACSQVQAACRTEMTVCRARNTILWVEADSSVTQVQDP
jgi:di/tricarboxylate transporter